MLLINGACCPKKVQPGVFFSLSNGACPSFLKKNLMHDPTSQSGSLSGATVGEFLCSIVCQCSFLVDARYACVFEDEGMASLKEICDDESSPLNGCVPIGEPPLIVCVEPPPIFPPLPCVLLKEVAYGRTPLKNPV